MKVTKEELVDWVEILEIEYSNEIRRLLKKGESHSMLDLKLYPLELIIEQVVDMIKDMEE